MVKHAANGIQIAGLRCVCRKRTRENSKEKYFLKDLFFPVNSVTVEVQGEGSYEGLLLVIGRKEAEALHSNLVCYSHLVKFHLVYLKGHVKVPMIDAI